MPNQCTKKYCEKKKEQKWPWKQKEFAHVINSIRKKKKKRKTEFFFIKAF